MSDEISNNENAAGYSEKKQDKSEKISANNKPQESKRRKNLIIISMSLVNFLASALFSLLAPFFPDEAQNMGASPSQVGLIFGIYSLIQFLFSPLCGKFLPQIGSKFMFLAGLFVCGGCAILFGLLDEVMPGFQFIIFCFLVRSVEALGASAVSTAAFTIIANEFPDNVSTMFGVLEVFSGLGYMLGPVIGGALYQTGGYKLPFLLLGSLVILLVPCGYFLLPSDMDDTKRESGSLLQVAKIPAVWSTSLTILIGGMALGFLDPTLANHLKQFQLSPTEVGLMFLVTGGSYMFSASIWGWLADKKDISRLLIIEGNLFCSGSFLLLGPSPLLKFEASLSLVIISLLFLGVSIGAALVPTFQDLLISVRWYGMPDDVTTYSVVSGLFTGLLSLGAFLGPTMGSYLTNNYGFNWAVTVFGGMYFAVGGIVALFCAWEFRCGKGRKKVMVEMTTILNEETGSIADDERKPLLS